MTLRIYLDSSVLNRPFDSQVQVRVRLETEAFLYILEKAEAQSIILCGSSVLDFEARQNPNPDRRQRVLSYLRLAGEYVEATPVIKSRSRALAQLGFKAIDALHIASAEFHDNAINFFITCDDGILKRAAKQGTVLTVKIVSPLDFVATEEFNHA
ncbi:MAG: PIN domain-containing protein [Acidobacteria bacterium]|nr:PIN domain-containing protein [Acidobacteriota bacterium]MBI3658682.1 PIN domain-containing protein [Acidobacteriota bacterium]